MPETPIFSGVPPWERVRDYFGLNFEAPKGGVENLQYSWGVVPAVRSGISRIMSLGDVQK